MKRMATVLACIALAPALLAACNNVGDCPGPSAITPGRSCSGDNLECPYTLETAAVEGGLQTSCVCSGGSWSCPSSDGGAASDDPSDGAPADATSGDGPTSGDAGDGAAAADGNAG